MCRKTRNGSLWGVGGKAPSSALLADRRGESQFHVYGAPTSVFFFFPFPERTLHFNEDLACILSAH